MSIESKTVRKCIAQLETALQSLETDVLQELLDQGLITQDNRKEYLRPRSMLKPIEKARILVEQIDNVVKLNPPSYNKLVKVFDEAEGDGYKGIVSTLKKKYAELQQGQKPSDSSAPQQPVAQQPGVAMAQPPAAKLSDQFVGIIFGEENNSSVESDGLGRITQYEARNRGERIPQLKLEKGDGITKLNIRAFKQPPQEQGYYKMGTPIHGVALIINNEHFRDGIRHKERVGTARDEHNLVETFLFLGYRPIVCHNLTTLQIDEVFSALDDFLKKSDDKAGIKVANDSFICCILSHGNSNEIIASDSKPIKREYIEKLAGKSKILNSKPKIFFIQACQGSGLGTEEAKRRVQPDETTGGRADFYICIASVLGDQSYRDTFTGSWFITEVCRILCEHAPCYSLHSDFQLQLNKNVADNQAYRYCVENKLYVQQPTCSNQLQKHVHFFSQSQE